MFNNLLRRHRQLSVDLDAIADTLRYIESDIADSAPHRALHDAIGNALKEVRRLQAAEDQSARTEEGKPSTAAAFVPLIPVEPR